MSDDNQSKAEGKGRDHPIAYEIIFIIMLVLVVGLISFSAGRQTTGNNVLLFGSSTAGGSAASKVVSANSANDDSPVVAIVDNKKITRNEIVEFLNTMPQQMQQFPSEQLVPLAIEQVINNKIVDEKAAQANLSNNIDVQTQLQNARQQIIRAKFIETEINKLMTEDRLKEGYEEYKKNFPEIEEAKAAHILVEDEQTANDIIAKLNNGGDFAALAKESSKDGTAEKGGDLGYFAKTDVVPEFAEAAFTTKPGTYTKQPVKSNFGYHIIKVEERRIRPAADFATAKPYLEQEMRRKILDEIVQKWREKADIERFDMNGQPLKAPENQEPAAGEANESDANAAPQEAPAAQASAPASKETAQ